MGALMNIVPIFPNVTVELVGSDGNAFNIIGLCNKEARKQNVPAEKINEFMNEAMSSDYSNLLRTCMKWFTIK
jgi:hypothetical protein